ncbi:phage tail tape measure protein, partial [bacterium]|nr:phage tail tape measure protein [bacterium]
RQVMIELASPSSKLKQAMKAAGIEMKTLNLESNTFVSVLRQLESAQLSTGQVMEIFGARGGGAALQLINLVDTVEDLDMKTRTNLNALTDMASTMRDNIPGAIKNFQSAFEELILQTGDRGLAGALRSVIDESTGVLRVWGNMADPFDENIERFEDTARAIEGISAALGTLLAVGAARGAIGAALSLGPVGWGLAGVAAGIGAVVAYRDELTAFLDPIEKQRQIFQGINREAGQTVGTMRTLASEYSALAGNMNLTAEQQTSLADKSRELIELNPRLAGVLDGTTESVRALNEELTATSVNQAVQNLGQQYTLALREYERLQESARNRGSVAGLDSMGAFPGASEEEISGARTRLNELSTEYRRVMGILRDGNIPLFGDSEKWQGATVATVKGLLGGDGDDLNGAMARALSEYKNFNRDIAGTARDLQDEMSLIGLTGTAARVRRAEIETAQMLREVDGRGASIRDAEELSASERAGLLAANLETRASVVALGEARISQIYEDALQDRLRDLSDKQRAEEAQTARHYEMLKQAAAGYTNRFDPGAADAARAGEINGLYNQGLIGGTVQARALADSQNQFRRHQNDILMASGEFSAGARVAFDEYADAAGNAANNAYRAFTNGLIRMEDALATSLQNWKFDFGDFASSIQADFSRLLVRQITAPAYQSIIDSIPVLSQPAAVTQAAPQSGGQVFAKQSAPGGGGNIYVSISTPDAQSFRASQRQIERQLAAAVQKAQS